MDRSKIRLLCRLAFPRESVEKVGTKAKKRNERGGGGGGGEKQLMSLTLLERVWMGLTDNCMANSLKFN